MEGSVKVTKETLAGDEELAKELGIQQGRS